jgi:hypothetical protein
MNRDQMSLPGMDQASTKVAIEPPQSPAAAVKKISPSRTETVTQTVTVTRTITSTREVQDGYYDDADEFLGFGTAIEGPEHRPALEGPPPELVD